MPTAHKGKNTRYADRMQHWINELNTTNKNQCFNMFRANDSFCALGIGLEVYKKRTKRGKWVELDDA